MILSGFQDHIVGKDSFAFSASTMCGIYGNIVKSFYSSVDAGGRLLGTIVCFTNSTRP
jgi:hypothetical protein